MLYTRHARKRMKIRRITPEQVESVYRDYETAVPAGLWRRNYFRVFPDQRRVVRVTVAAATSAGPLAATVAEIPLR
jgi:hypothetical protein